MISEKVKDSFSDSEGRTKTKDRETTAGLEPYSRPWNKTLSAGKHQITFNAGRLPSGTYLYKIETPAGSESKKMTLIK